MVMQTNSSNYTTILQRDQISAAICSAEKSTNGEIFAVFAKESDNYFFISFFIWTVAIFFTSIIAAYGIHWFWHDVPLHYFASTVLAIHLLGLFYLSILPQLRLLITPAAIKNRICHANAVRQFLAQNINRTKKRTGILLFISQAEHYAEVISDIKIVEKVPAEIWTDIVKGMMTKAREGHLTEAYLEAIKKSGEVLTHYFPRNATTENELPDHIIEI